MSNIIIIDDSQDFIQTFANEAKAKNIDVVSEKSLAGLKKLLPTLEHKFAAVVLDIKCLLEDDQDKEDSGFIGSALTYLNSTIPLFPRFILTGDESEFDALRKFYKNERMFIKQPQDMEKLFQELEYCVQQAEPLRIKRDNIQIFDAFERELLPANKETTVINIIKLNNEKDPPANFRGVIGDIRDVHEEIYKSLNRRNRNIVPNRFINGNGSPTFTNDFNRHMAGYPDSGNKYTPTTPVYQDSTISSHTQLIHRACSEYLHSSSKTQYSISKYTVKSLINSLMELIIWSKQY